MKKKLILGLGFVFLLVGMLTGCGKESAVYTVSFNSNGGSSVESQSVVEGDVVEKPTDPTKDGYLFVQWLLDGEKYDFSSKVNSNITLIAEWLKQEEEKEYITIKFNSDGGSTIANQIIENGNKVEKPSDPTKDGYTFVEWQLNNSAYNFETVVTENMELVAKWEKNKATSNNNNNNSSSNSNSNSNSNNNNSSSGSTISNKFSTPVLSEVPMGNFETNGTQNTFVGIDKVQDGSLEIYYSTSKNGTYKLLRTATKADQGTTSYAVSIPVGNTYYFKVRFVSNNTYSEYSNIVSIDNSYSQPVLSEIPMGSFDANGTQNTFVGIDKEQFGSLEIYYATSENGTYKLLRTATAADQGTTSYAVSVPIGNTYYFKVRFVSDAGAYSEYSNVVGIANNYSQPVISELPLGSFDTDGTKNTYIGIDKEQFGSLEIYYATSENGTYSCKYNLLF